LALEVSNPLPSFSHSNRLMRILQHGAIITIINVIIELSISDVNVSGGHCLFKAVACCLLLVACCLLA
jgi:hypothetical protein